MLLLELLSVNRDKSHFWPGLRIVHEFQICARDFDSMIFSTGRVIFWEISQNA
jgi:hypothetical protein